MASTSIQSQVTTGNKLGNMPLSFNMSLSPGAASSASPASSVAYSVASGVNSGAGPGRSTTPSPDRNNLSLDHRRSPVRSHHLVGGGGHPHDLAYQSIRRPSSAGSPPVRDSPPSREANHSAAQHLQVSLSGTLHGPGMSSSMSFAALHVAAAAAAANQSTLLHGKVGLPSGMGPGVSVSLAGMTGIPGLSDGYHPGLYLDHPAAAAAAAQRIQLRARTGTLTKGN